MSRAQAYLKQILTPEQYEAWREQAALDSRDSTARKKYRYIRTPGMDKRQAKSVETARAWLLRFGYINQAGEWIADVKL